MRWRSALSSALFAMLIATATAESQSDTGAIIGMVQDVTGAVIPGVSVMLTNPGALGGNQQTISDEGGNYRFTRLIPASYSIRAELPGFRAVSRQGLVVNADKTVRVDVGFITQAKFTSMITPSMVLDATVGYNFLHWPDEHQKEVIPGDLSRFDILTQTTTVAAASYNYQNIDRGSFAANLSYTNRRHDVKIGFATSPRTMQRQVNWGMSHYPSGMQARYRNGVPDSVDLYNTPNDSSVFLNDYAYFIQDKWKIKRLTMNLGLRLETKNGRVPAQCQPDGAFIKRTCYPEIKNVPDWMDLVPRFGVSYDIFGNGRTAFKVSANRYSITVGNTHLNRVNPLQLASNNVPWTDRNRDLIPQPDELGQGTGFDLSVYNRYNPGIKRPYNNEYTIGLQHEFPGAFVGSVTFAHRDVRRNIGLRNVAVTTQSYIPIAVTEPTTGSRLNVYNLAPALRTSRDNLFDNYKELDTFYNGVDLTFEKRFKGNGSLVYGGLSLGGNHGDFLPAADLNDPNNNIRRGRVDLDVPVSIQGCSAIQSATRIHSQRKRPALHGTSGTTDVPRDPNAGSNTHSNQPDALHGAAR